MTLSVAVLAILAGRQARRGQTLTVSKAHIPGGLLTTSS